MTLARECIKAMGGFNKDADRSALLAVLLTLRDRGPSAKATQLAKEAMCAAVEGNGPWITVEDCFRIQLAELIREIEEER